MTLRGPLAHSRSTGLIALGFAHLAACTAMPDGDPARSPSPPPAKPSPQTLEAPERPPAKPRPSSERAASRDREEPSEATVSPSGASTPMEGSAAGIRPDLSTGTVTFRGLGADQLANIQVIPEMGATLVPAADGAFQGVDGLWLRGERRWFKIPGGTQVVVSVKSPELADAPAAASPSGTERTLIAGDLVFQVTSSAASAVYQQLKGPGAMAGWQGDEGSSAHPTDYPF